jgi:hypothetical protein
MTDLEMTYTSLDMYRNPWDISSEDWYKKHAGKLVLLVDDQGSVQKVLGRINSDDDIVRIMLRNNLIKEGQVTNSLRQQYGLVETTSVNVI